MIRKVKLTREEKINLKREELAKKEKVAAIWTRVSSKDQYNNNCSIETQIEGCRAYCKRNNIRIKKEFGGKNESAKKAGELFLDMIGEILNDPEYNTVVVFDFDRFSRDSDDGIIYKSKVKRSGISVKSVNQPIDENNVLADQIENILIILADIENAMRRHKCHRGMVDCINRGEWYSRPPLGYDSKKVNKHHVITVNEKGKILKKAFEWITDEPEITQSEIINRLKHLGLTISKQRLSECLRNSFYCGRIEHRYLETDGLDKPYIMGVQEPMITEEMFDKVQNILNGNNHCDYEHAEETPKFPLKRFVRCANDDHVLSGYTTKGKDYYRCSVKGCRTNISAEILHMEFENILGSYNLHKDLRPLFIQVMEEKFKEREKTNEDDKRLLNKNLATLQTQLKKNYGVGEIEKDIFEEVEKDLTMDIKQIEQKLKQLNESSSNLSLYLNKGIEISSKLSSYWKVQDFKLCQKIQKLTFPNGIKWDGKNRILRTEGANEFLAKIALVGTSMANLGKRKTDQISDLSVLVAGTGLEPATSGL